ncbi:hypothetical protein BROUX41_004351 [Berkeleyomyces rouxiae]
MDSDLMTFSAPPSPQISEAGYSLLLPSSNNEVQSANKDLCSSPPSIVTADRLKESSPPPPVHLDSRPADPNSRQKNSSSDEDKKARDDIAFSSFLQQRQLEKTDSSSANTALVKPWSAGWLMRTAKQRIIDSPREYQLDLFEKAKKQNTIIVLDTGSGKTLISVLLLRYTAEQELQRTGEGLDRRVSFFLAEKVSLVNQQYHVIKNNLPYPTTHIWGSSTNRSWAKEEWATAMKENMIVVCTAAILRRALESAYVKMSQINLLVLDEAHHAKKNHPYARIIKDFYLCEAEATRPRILGMTASPVDTQDDVRFAAQDLEDLLCSTIATVEGGTLRDDSDRGHQQIKIQYDFLDPPSQTDFVKTISRFLARNQEFRKLLVFSEQAVSTLGSWCVDRLWKVWVTEEDVLRLTAKSEAVDSLYAGEKVAPAHDIRVIADAVRSLRLEPLEISSRHLSSKVMALIQVLSDLFQHGDEHKCIVFVDMRYTAIMLDDLFKQPAINKLEIRAAPLFGVSPGKAGMSNVQQNITIHKFRLGKLNCLFATSVAEEGLDIPDCDTVIRFDLYNTMIQYIQSRGRARHQDSRYYVMMEAGNADHVRKVTFAARNADVLRRFCAQLPKDRILADPSVTLNRYFQEHAHINYRIPSSGARLGWVESVSVLEKFTAHLATTEQRQCGQIPRPEYHVIQSGKEFSCHINLPSSSPISSCKGSPQASKPSAKCAAAFQMCVNLIDQGFIDENLEPIFKKVLPIMRNARLAISEKKKEVYKMIVKPSFWNNVNGDGFSKDWLNGVAITLSNPDALQRRSNILILLSHAKMPSLPDIHLFLGPDRESSAQIRPLIGTVPSSKIPQLKNFTLRVFRDVFSKDFVADKSELPYFLAPSTMTHESLSVNMNLYDVVDWDTVQVCEENEYLQIGNKPPEAFYADKFCIDPYDGGRKLFLIGVRADLHPLDPIPSEAPQPRFRAWRNVTHNIKEYSISIWGPNRAKRAWSDNQLVVEGRIMSLRRNLLEEIGDGDNDGQTNSPCFVIMEPLKISTIPPATVAIAGTFPAIIHRIESTLIALEASCTLGLTIRPDLALAALTKTKENTESYRTEQGSTYEDYERLEFLGDAFLKMATTVSLFTRMPSSNEFEYHVERMILISNKNMFNNAMDLGLHEFIRTKKFDRRGWYPTGLVLRQGKSTDIQGSQALGDKSIADVCEAFIGAAYVSAFQSPDGLATSARNFDMAVKAVTVMVNHENHRMTAFKDYFDAYKAPAWLQATPTVPQADFANKLGDITGYKFRNPLLARSAFKHPSYPWEDVPHYQNLEFLGDALLDMATIDFLYKTFPRSDPQWLTEHKMAMVSNRFLGCLSVEVGFHSYLLTTSAHIMASIASYSDQLQAARSVAEEESKVSGSGYVEKNYWADDSLRPPKCLPDIVEAYVGAVFVDSGYNYSTVYDFFTQYIRPYFEDMQLYDSYASQQPVTFLVKKFQTDFRCQDWEVVVKEQPVDLDAGALVVKESQVVAGILVHGRVVATGESDSARLAKLRAALEALEVLKTMNKTEFRAEFGCRCLRG